MNWTAIVPIKGGAEQKSRLAPALSLDQRRSLCEAMRAHVLGVLRTTPQISVTAVLAPALIAPSWTTWIPDRGGGLNAELRAARLRMDNAPMLIIHADLPLLSADDVKQLLLSAEAEGAAIAPDVKGLGTNALAVADGRRFEFSFQGASLEQHKNTLGAPLAVVRRHGLEFDVDTPADLTMLTGIVPEWASSFAEGPQRERR